MTIDDVEHELRLMQDFGAIPHQELARDLERFEELWAQPTLSKADQKTYEKLAQSLLDRVVVDPKALREQLDGDDPLTGQPRLSGEFVRGIIMAFTNAPLLIATGLSLPELLRLTAMAQDAPMLDPSTTES